MLLGNLSGCLRYEKCIADEKWRLMSFDYLWNNSYLIQPGELYMPLMFSTFAECKAQEHWEYSDIIWWSSLSDGLYGLFAGWSIVFQSWLSLLSFFLPPFSVILQILSLSAEAHWFRCWYICLLPPCRWQVTNLECFFFFLLLKFMRRLSCLSFKIFSCLVQDNKFQLKILVWSWSISFVIYLFLLTCSRASDFGLVKIDEKGRITQFIEKPKGENLKSMVCYFAPFSLHERISLKLIVTFSCLFKK